MRNIYNNNNIFFGKLFEGMKAYKDANGKIRLFRPMKNMDRMVSSCERLAFPVWFFLSRINNQKSKSNSTSTSNSSSKKIFFRLEIFWRKSCWMY